MLAEYQKAPAVTRDRMYLDTMQQIFSNTTKVMVDAESGNNLMYLPLDKLIAQSRRRRRPPRAFQARPVDNAAASAGRADAADHRIATRASDARSREAANSRDRETR